MAKTIADTLQKLENDVFRGSFYLTEWDKEYLFYNGNKIEGEIRDIIRVKLADAVPENEGNQTPLSGHPAYKAMHGCACCCRACLNKWYRVPVGVPLSELQQEKIAKLLLAWLEKEQNRSKALDIKSKFYSKMEFEILEGVETSDHAVELRKYEDGTYEVTHRAGKLYCGSCVFDSYELAKTEYEDQARIYKRGQKQQKEAKF